MARQATALGFMLLLVATTVPADAFCVYNKSPSPVTYFAWPVAAQSFKAVVQPGGEACCNFNNPTCFAKGQGDTSDNPLGQCAPVVFYITQQSVDTGKITRSFIQESISKILGPLLTAVGVALAPFTGGTSTAIAALGIGSASLSAGLTVSDAVADTGIPFLMTDVFQPGFNGGTVTWNGIGQQASVTTQPTCASSG